MEEAPAPDLDPDLRALLHASSVALCREVGYVGAGTVEFLVATGPDGTQTGYFLEMNTRLQVEHPGTEVVTGLDLVQWQLAVAAGEPLPLTQDEITCTGHAVEVRVYAEDPYAGFLPQAGTVVDVGWGYRGQGDPDEDGGPPDDLGWRRVHAAFDEGDDRYEVTSSYDPMLAKLVGRGSDREGAIDDVLRTIDDSRVAGIATNLGWVRRLVDSAAFRAGEVHTGWLDAYEGPLLERPEVSAEALAAAASLLPHHRDHPPELDRDRTPFGAADGFRLAGPPAAVVVHLVDAEGRPHAVDVADRASGGRAGRDGRRVGATWQGQTHLREESDAMRRTSAAAAGDADVVAPMPGTVVALEVAVGDAVTSGQRLGAVEAMKMELALLAPHDGTVTHVGAAVGEQVAMGHVLVHVEEAS